MAGCAAGGLVIGDVLEPLADRLPKKLPLDRPWWRCPSCDAPDTSVGRVPFASDPLPVLRMPHLR